MTSLSTALAQLFALFAIFGLVGAVAAAVDRVLTLIADWREQHYDALRTAALARARERAAGNTGQYAGKTPIDVKNERNLDAWLALPLIGGNEPDMRDEELRQRGQRLQWRLEDARTYVKERKRQKEADAAIDRAIRRACRIAFLPTSDAAARRLSERSGGVHS